MTVPPFDLDRVRLRAAPTADLSATDLAALRSLLDAAFADDEDPVFPESDWLHAMGGVHFLAELDGRLLAHASVVPRRLRAGARVLHTGYVEAVATLPELQGRGLGSLVMRAANGHILEQYELGALGTGSQGFYEWLGWEVWLGPTFVETSAGAERTPDEDGGILVLRTPSTGSLDLSASLTCDWRPGDVW